MTIVQLSIITLLNAALCVVVNMLEGFALGETLIGMAVLLFIIAVGVLIHRVIPWKGLPAVAYICTFGCILTIPGLVPGSEFFSDAASKINFMGTCTPILAYAGLALGKDLDLLKRQGWRIVVVGLMVFVGTFLGSAIIAEIVLRCIN